MTTEGLETFKTEEIYDFDEPPASLTNKTCITFWYLNKNVRDVLKSPAWKNKLKTGAFPYFCVHNGFCRYFQDKNGLDAHFSKNPSHRLHNFEEYQKEAQRRIHLRQNSYMTKIKNCRSERSPTPTNSIKSNSSSNGSRGRSISPTFMRKCPDCFLELPTMEKYEDHVRNRVLNCQSYRPPSPTVPHPDDVRFDQLLESSSQKMSKIPLVPKLPPECSGSQLYPPLKPWNKFGSSSVTNHPLVNKWKETMTKIIPTQNIGSASRMKHKDPRLLNLGSKSIPQDDNILDMDDGSIESYDISDPQKIERDLGLRRNSSIGNHFGGVQKFSVDPIMKTKPKNVPTTVSSSILGKLNLSMPKPDFSRTHSLDQDNPSILQSKSNPRVLERDPRKRKSSLFNLHSQSSSDLLQREPVVKIPKMKPIVQEESNDPKPLGPRKKISMAQYLTKSSLSHKANQENLQSSERLPALPAVDELFTSQDSFEPESVQVPVRIPTPEESIKEEPKEDYEKQYFSKRLKNTVSSWNVSKKTLRTYRRNSVVSETKIEKIKDYKASQHDDNLQATQSSEDLFHPDVIIKEGKECLEPDEPDDDSKESTVIHAEVIFETVPAIVDPDSTEGAPSEPDLPNPEPSVSTPSSPKPSEDTSEIINVPNSSLDENSELQNPELSSSIQTPEELPSKLEIPEEPSNTNNDDDQDNVAINIQEALESTVVPSTNESEILVSSEEAVIVIESDTNGIENIDDEVIALVQASVELISQQADQFNANSPPDFYEETSDQIPTSVAQVEVSCPPSPEPMENGSTIFLVQGVDTSIDFCPDCSTKLCPFRGGYSVNCANFDVQLKCHGCLKNIVIKKSFSQHQKSVLWLNTTV